MRNYVTKANQNQMFVDTGRTTGWAYFNTKDVIYGSITCPKSIKTREIYIDYMYNKFDDLLMKNDIGYIKQIWLEEPEYWIGSFKSQTASTRDNLFDLQACTITYACAAKIGNAISFKLIKAREWKGQLSKNATATRVKRITGIENVNEHIIDAIAMGLSRDRRVWSLGVKSV